ncbi:hypothetical protein JTE90_027578 [Oedothorax gibbosus]|uniref:Uncharacterized protein n=1 Tax=Oedothorax gibbosus TaxID=931172 RepID=A0AAV6VL29_9ARAC|nr:hypothetical protein JTE90_027578 [Oedothorax gibbosus]
MPQPCCCATKPALNTGNNISHARRSLQMKKKSKQEMMGGSCESKKMESRGPPRADVETLKMMERRMREDKGECVSTTGRDLRWQRLSGNCFD